MNIKTIIKDNIAALDEPPTYYHGIKEFQNLQADSDVFPIAYLDEPIESNDTLQKSGYITEEYPVTILFADKSGLDATTDEHDVIIADMRIVANKFIIKCQADPLIKGIKGSKKTEVVNLFDTNITGILLQVTIIPFQTDSVCE